MTGRYGARVPFTIGSDPRKPEDLAPNLRLPAASKLASRMISGTSHAPLGSPKLASSLSRTMNAPARPWYTCSPVIMCGCGWYQLRDARCATTKLYA